MRATPGPWHAGVLEGNGIAAFMRKHGIHEAGCLGSSSMDWPEDYDWSDERSPHDVLALAAKRVAGRKGEIWQEIGNALLAVEARLDAASEDDLERLLRSIDRACTKFNRSIAGGAS